MRTLLFLILISILSPALSLAAPGMRGFQIQYSDVDAAFAASLKNDWGVNVVRIQLGNNDLQDGTTGQAYIDMMNAEIGVLDQALPHLAANGIQVILALYSPPGGFETRDKPSHYLMFSQPNLQTDYLDMWRALATYYKDNDTIYAYDLLNEPAMRKSSKSPNAKSWNELLIDTIAAIRAIDNSTLIMIKSLYGDPNKLAALPAVSDPNVIYSFHAYVFNKYQHSGITSVPFQMKRPKANRIATKLNVPLAKFYQKQKKFNKKGLVGNFPPRINAGEFGVSSCAKESAIYMQDLIDAIERASKKTKKIKCGKRSAKVCKQLKRASKALKIESWTNHAYYEAVVWDPRYTCDAQGNFILQANTDRGQVLQSFFALN